MKKRALALLAVAACSSSSPAPPKPAAESPVASTAAPPEPTTAPVAPVETPAPVAGDPPGAWVTRPPAKADFYVALDGICRYLSIRKAGTDAFAITTAVPYILTPNVMILARLTPTGLEDMSKGAGPVAAMSGQYPDALFAENAGQERMYSDSEILKWETDKWIRAFKDPHRDDEKAMRRGFELPIRYKDGWVSVSKWLKPGANPSVPAPSDYGADVQTYGMPQSVVAPLVKGNFHVGTLHTRKTGELFATGEYGDATHPAIRWLDASGVAHEFTSFGNYDWHNGFSLEDDRVVSNGKTIAAYDGTTFATKDLPPPLPAPPAKREPPVKGATVIGDKWAFSKDTVWEHDGSAWKEKTLPPPAFGTSTARSISSFVEQPNGEVSFVVGYYEKGRGWRAPVLYHALLRSKRPAETLRCNEPDPEDLDVSSGNGFTSWPPLADESCTTPFVILSRKSNAHPPAKDWPALRAALKGKTTLGDTLDLVEVRAGDRTYVGAQTKTLADARTLLDTVAKTVAIRGEVVCAKPQPTTTWHVNLETGALE